MFQERERQLLLAEGTLGTRLSHAPAIKLMAFARARVDRPTGERVKQGRKVVKASSSSQTTTAAAQATTTQQTHNTLAHTQACTGH